MVPRNFGLFILGFINTDCFLFEYCLAIHRRNRQNASVFLYHQRTTRVRRALHVQKEAETQQLTKISHTETSLLVKSPVEPACLNGETDDRYEPELKCYADGESQQSNL